MFVVTKNWCMTKQCFLVHCLSDSVSPCSAIVQDVFDRLAPLVVPKPPHNAGQFSLTILQSSSTLCLCDL